MTSRVIYNGDLRTTSVHLQSGTEILSDAPKDNHGKGEAFFSNGFSSQLISHLYVFHYGN